MRGEGPTSAKVTALRRQRSGVPGKSPSHGPSGEIIRWYGVSEDIDERIALEEEISKSRARN